VIVQFAGMGRGKLALNGGNVVIGPAATKWLMVGYYDSGGGELDVTNGNLSLENSSSIKMCRSGNTGTNIVNQVGGKITFYSDSGVTLGGGGNLDLSYAGGASSASVYNLNGGTLSVPKVISTSTSGTRVFNFNGGTLKAETAGASFFAAGVANVANVRGFGAVIDSTNLNISIGQPLVHSTITGDALTDGGLNKVGVGTLTLNGTNIYNGRTIVSNGTLALGGTGSIASSGKLIVSAGALLDVSAVSGGFVLGAAQTLSGNGAVNGAVVVNGTIAPGLSLGTMSTLTLSNSPVLNGQTLMQIDRNGGTPLNDQIVLPTGTFNYGGTLTVTNVGASLQAGDTFQLFSAPAYGGAFAVTNLPALGSGLAWSNSLPVNGSLSVVATVSLVPTNITFAVTGTAMTLSWPADHTGWRLQVQTNDMANGLGTNWIDVAGATTTNSVGVLMDPNNGSVFYRLVFP